MNCQCGTEMVRVLAATGSWACVRCRAYCTDGTPPAWNHALAPSSFVGHAAIVGALEVLKEIERRSAQVMVPQTDQ